MLTGPFGECTVAVATAVTLADVLVTHELAQRPVPTRNDPGTKQAILELAALMADGPDEVLPRFVDLAMEMTGSVSAGISIAEPPVFRWAFLRGTLAAFEGATTPRNFSPCGLTLDADSPILCRHAERYYDWIADVDIVVPEVLLIPLHRGEELLGTLWNVAPEVGHFHRGHVAAVTELGSFVSTALRMHQTEQRLRSSLAEQETLAREMSHRLKNVFSVVDSMIQLSASKAGSARDLASALSGRVHALAAAHGLIRRSFANPADVREVSALQPLLQAVLQPHEALPTQPPRFKLHGPAVSLGEHATNGIALVFHELATNAVKYGALAKDAGHVEIGWQVQDGTLTMAWRERGGPLVAGAPSASGFGTRLIQNMVEATYGGSLTYDWTPEGLVVSLTLPVDRLAT
jgi:two-component sensor histidine kinase